MFGDIEVAISSQSSSSLQAIVPENAVTGSLLLKSSANNQIDLGTLIIIPTIESYTPEHLEIGETLTIVGKGFSPEDDAYMLSINGVETNVFTEITNTQITLDIPTEATTGATTLTYRGSTLDFGSLMVIPTIESIAPESLEIGETLTITGQGFSPDDNYVIDFNGVETSFTEITTSQATLEIPENATTGIARLFYHDHDIEVGTIIIKPTIEEVEYGLISIGESLIIVGAGFSPEETYTVFFGDIEATILEITNGSITVEVPEDAINGNITIVYNEETTTAGSYFTGPAVEAISSLYGQIGDSITFTGQFFSTDDTYEITFNGVPATITEQTETNISVTVPEGATSGALIFRFNSTELINNSFVIVQTNLYFVGSQEVYGFKITEINFYDGTEIQEILPGIDTYFDFAEIQQIIGFNEVSNTLSFYQSNQISSCGDPFSCYESHHITYNVISNENTLSAGVCEFGNDCSSLQPYRFISRNGTSYLLGTDDTSSINGSAIFESNSGAQALGYLGLNYRSLTLSHDHNENKVIGCVLNTDTNTYHFFKLNLGTGETTYNDSFSFSKSLISGDGRMFVVESASNQIHQLNTSNGSIINTINLPFSTSYTTKNSGFSDATNELIMIDSGNLYKINVDTGEAIEISLAHLTWNGFLFVDNL